MHTVFIEWAPFHLMDALFNPPLNISVDLNLWLFFASSSHI